MMDRVIPGNAINASRAGTISSPVPPPCCGSLLPGGMRKRDARKEAQQQQQQVQATASAAKTSYERAYKACLEGKGYSVQ